MVQLIGIRVRLRQHMLQQGVKVETVNRALGTLGDGKLLEWLKLHGPDIMRLALLILSLIGEAPPKTPPAIKP